MVSIETTYTPDVGNMHVGDGLLIHARGKVLDLGRATLAEIPIKVEQFPLGEDHCLLWGWATTGGDEEEHHFYVIGFRKERLQLLMQFAVKAPRGEVFIGMKRAERGGMDLMIAGNRTPDVPETAEMEISPTQTLPLAEFKRSDETQLQKWLRGPTWKDPYLSRDTGNLAWGIPIHCSEDGVITWKRLKK